MSLLEVVDAVAGSLVGVPVGAISTEPPTSLPELRMIVLYPQPANTLPAQHRGRTGRIVYVCRDQVVLEYHWVMAQTEMGRNVRELTEMLDLIRDRLWLAGTPTPESPLPFGGKVTQLHAIDTNFFGEMGWSDEQNTFGFRLLIDVSHAQEIDAV